ncbi:MAG TPA: hypothetical protein VGH87_04850 [Polyangiaceae bacterium]|jgi:hypothetical protein|nr:hypothetical protein [Polyangiaceae bacterium]
MKKEERYVRPSIAGWLLPTTIGTFLSAYGATSLYAAFGPLPDLVPRTVFWVVGMAVATAWALVFVLLQSVIDLALLTVRLRALANGKAAWFSALVAPLLPIATYAAYSPHKWWKLGPWAVAIAVLVPMVVSVIATRVVLGKKPG